MSLWIQTWPIYINNHFGNSLTPSSFMFDGWTEWKAIFNKMWMLPLRDTLHNGPEFQYYIYTRWISLKIMCFSKIFIEFVSRAFLWIKWSATIHYGLIPLTPFALIAWLNYISSLGIFINQDFRCFFTLAAMPLEILHPLGHIKS